jgi:uncharacterized protein (DUF1800 family)
MRKAMALDPKTAALALHRFGFGPRAGSIAAIASDPRGALIAELDQAGAGQIATTNLLTSGGAVRAVFEWNAERLAKEKLARLRREAAGRAGADAGDPQAAPAMEAKPPAQAPNQGQEPPLPRQIFLKEAKARFDAAVGAEIGFVERLVWFWSNHFCVNADSSVMAGGYEREAIRAHVLGRFADMLLAVESHPAMLIYLNNEQSVGPTSSAGINRDRGLNENLAREILELHTLGVRTVYTQADVTNFAKVITGWTMLPPVSDPNHGGEFVFLRRAHEPGPETVVGKTYPDNGVEQGRAVLADLARHPATARHVATKLARHFIADEPPEALVDRLALRFLETDGDLKQVAMALVTAPESWSEEQPKIKRPGEWVVALLRAAGPAGASAAPGDIGRIVGALALLGEPLWRPPAPKGFADDNAAWLDGLAQRLDVANAFAQRLGPNVDPQAIADVALGPLASPETRSAMARAESRPQAMTLLLMSSEFQRR